MVEEYTPCSARSTSGKMRKKEGEGESRRPLVSAGKKRYRI
jgi:hypothetical protein